MSLKNKLINYNMEKILHKPTSKTKTIKMVVDLNNDTQLACIANVYKKSLAKKLNEIGITKEEAIKKLREINNNDEDYHSVFNNLIKQRLMELDPEFIKSLQEEYKKMGNLMEVEEKKHLAGTTWKISAPEEECEYCEKCGCGRMGNIYIHDLKDKFSDCKNDWEKEFDERFQVLPQNISEQYQKQIYLPAIKQFIRNLLK